MAATELIDEQSMTKERMDTLFTQAFFSTSYDQDGDLVVQTEGPRVYVMIDPEKKLLKFMSIYGLKDAPDREGKQALTNRMNDQIIFGRFAVPQKRSDMLVADYFLPYEGGIPAFQVVTALRLFARVVPAAIRVCDEDDLVE